MRLLVVEDETKLAKAMQRALTLQHYAVDVASDGQTGWELASVEPYDLIILDLLLPNLDGREICRRLRADRLETPILMLTALGEIADRVIGLDAGADDYLVKPFALVELFARVRALLRRGLPNRETKLQVADLTLDPVNAQATRDGQRLDLSPKEYAILAYLLYHHNRPVSKEQLLRHVWDYQADVLPNTVEVHVRNLRRKVDAPFKQALITTVRGFGYQIGGQHV